MARRNRGRSLRGRSSVFNPGASKFSQRAVSPSAASSRQPAMTETAPRSSVLGPGLESVLNPMIEEGAPEGMPGPPVDVDFGGGGDEGSDVIDAIMGDEMLPAETGGEYTPQGPAPFIPEILENMPRGPAPMLPDIMRQQPIGTQVEEYPPQPSSSAGLYNKAKLARILMEEGY